MRPLQTTLTISLILLFAAAASAKIVFSTDQNLDSNIFVMEDDGSNVTQITDYPHSEVRPRWSPDGKQIAFLRDTNPSSTVHLNTFIMNADGTNVRQLTNYKGNDRGLAFSPDGKKLLVSSLSNTSGGPLLGLYAIDIESGKYKRLSDFIIDGVDWSPDGTKIVFENTDFNFGELTEDNIWMMNADGTDARAWIPPIRVPRTIDREKPRWSPNGQRILYTEIDRIVVETKGEDGSIGRRISHAGTYRYLIRDVNGGGAHPLKVPEDWIPYSVAWMDDGESVLFSAFVDFEHWQDRDRWAQVYKYDVGSGIITQLTHDRGDKLSADWVSDNPFSTTSVSPVGKQPVRWSELKKTYSD